MAGCTCPQQAAIASSILRVGDKGRPAVGGNHTSRSSCSAVDPSQTANAPRRCFDEGAAAALTLGEEPAFYTVHLRLVTGADVPPRKFSIKICKLISRTQIGKTMMLQLR